MGVWFCKFCSLLCVEFMVIFVCELIEAYKQCSCNCVVAFCVCAPCATARVVALRVLRHASSSPSPLTTPPSTNTPNFEVQSTIASFEALYCTIYISDTTNNKTYLTTSILYNKVKVCSSCYGFARQ